MDSETVELKSSLIVNLTITCERIIDPDKYSSLLKILRITAYIFRFENALGLQKDNDAKQYILLITCAVTRSIHLELVGSMTTDTFLPAFRRFVARRGLYSMVISDNARTFKRAELELQQMWKVLNHADVKNFYSAHSIKWNCIVERAAWWGGLYERMMRSVKVALQKTLGRSSLTTEQLLAVLNEIEGMIISRPITYVGSETEESIPLTPAHFTRGKRITSLPPVRLRLGSNLYSRKCLIKCRNGKVH
ncbi:integrase catalytic domain-containing protein [Trichonephila clavipes]|nr:integrase catalytic domain-containing protein [Trichonephila clavipes]